jgi:hypothetical protein
MLQAGDIFALYGMDASPDNAARNPPSVPQDVGSSSSSGGGNGGGGGSSSIGAKTASRRYRSLRFKTLKQRQRLQMEEALGGASNFDSFPSIVGGTSLL